MSGKPRPRRDCTVCGRKNVAVQTNGGLWPHKWPGWGLWLDGGDCYGEPRRSRAAAAILGEWEASREK